jgi:tetratricopeptide (TPR) repeat protein
LETAAAGDGGRPGGGDIVTRSDLRLLTGALLAVIVPAAILDLTADDLRQAAGLSAVPFAWRRILLAHLIAALPLGVMVARRLRGLPAVVSLSPWVWAALGVVTSGVAAAASAAAGDVAAQSDWGEVPLLFLRALAAFVLVLPWCIAALDGSSALEQEAGEFKASRSGLSGVALAVGLGLAVLPCGLYTRAAAASRTEQAAILLAQQRLSKAAGVVTGLCELGSRRPIGTSSPAQTRQRLTSILWSLRHQADGPLPVSAPPGARVGRAVLLVQLERLDQATDVLRPLAPGDDTARLMLAAIYRNQERWAESDALYTATLGKLLPLARTNEAARSACRSAFDGLADNAQSCGRPADAAATLHRGLQELPADAAYFHFLLGRHYHEAGRFRLALDHLRTAARLDATGFSIRADDLIRQIRTATPGCLAGATP